MGFFQTERHFSEREPRFSCGWSAQAGLIGMWVLTNCIFSFSFIHPFSTPKILCVWAIGCFYLARSQHDRAAPDPKTWVLMIWPMVTLFWTKNQAAALPDVMVWLTFSGFMLCAIRPLGLMLRHLRHALSISGILVAVIGIAQAAGWDPWQWDTPRQAASVFGNPNFSAHFLLLSLSLGRFPGRVWGVAFRIMIALGILVCGSKLVFLVCLGWWTASCHRLTWNKRLLAGAGLILCLGLAGAAWRMDDIRHGITYVTHPQTYSAGLREQPDLIADRDPWFRGKRLSLMARVIVWRNSVDMIPEHLFWGGGFAAFTTTYPRYATSAVEDPLMTAHYRVRHAHQAVIDGIIHFGAIWLIFAVSVLVVWLKKIGPGPYRRAVLAQICLALGSLNYLNPIVLVHLVLLRPRRRLATPTRTIVWLFPLMCMFILALGTLDLKVIARRNGWAVLDHLYAAERGAAAYERGDYVQAFRALRIACLQDPFGPASMFNVSQAAMARSQEPGDVWSNFAMEGWVLCSQLFPRFSPAHTELTRWVDTPEGQAFVRPQTRSNLTDVWAEHAAWISRLRALNRNSDIDARKTSP